MCKEGKIVALGYKCITVNTVMTIPEKVRKDSPVTPELRMNIAHIVVLITVETIVVVVPALVRTEFLI